MLRHNFCAVYVNEVRLDPIFQSRKWNLRWRKHVFSVVAAFLALTIIICRVATFIITPLWLDYFNNSTAQWSNLTDSFANSTDDDSSDNKYRSINVFFIIAWKWGFGTFASATVLLVFLVSGRITEVERKYPKRDLILCGVAQGIATVLFNYSISGTRTAPYLQAVLSNFVIPNQFIVRFLVLRKWPSRMKLICAVVIIVAELICLIPKIFPQLEDRAQQRRDGGSSGIGGVLWPMCMVLSQIPFALANSLIEKSAQSKSSPGGGVSTTHDINIALIAFFNCAFDLLTICCLFWLDILPNFGMSPNLRTFAETFAFSAKCLVGYVEECRGVVMALGWIYVFISTTATFVIPMLMRYSEGANFMVIVLALRTPLVFLFWALFQEQPFHWNPRAHLSTWLSIGAIIIMIPTIAIYKLSAPERASPNILVANGYDRGFTNDREQLIVDTEDDNTRDITRVSQENSHSRSFNDSTMDDTLRILPSISTAR